MNASHYRLFMDMDSDSQSQRQKLVAVEARGNWWLFYYQHTRPIIFKRSDVDDCDSVESQNLR